MATLSFGIATTCLSAAADYRRRSNWKWSRPRIVCVGWDPEGVLGPPQTGHLARFEFKRRLERDADAREAFQRQVREEKERRQSLRQSRPLPDTPQDLIEYFLDTEAQEIEFEIARMRPRFLLFFLFFNLAQSVSLVSSNSLCRLNEEFFAQLKFELGQLRFAVNKTQLMEDRQIELEALEKAILEGLEAYDKMQGELVKARASLTKILTSKDAKATLLEMVEKNEINRSLLALLDENIASAQKGNQKQAAEYMEKLRGAVLRYITV
ncbi:hypothetical protein JHK85_030550 [Glycine max]|uniref:uncharacterized protein isoform X1 n=1 Tax=Glycine max TaxID=3847 RepID=UPI001B3564AA|nr:uncharacterized protein LOC100775621 isoform X1 [Glycine max]KAG4987567.1 hypothetical protein JHK85_030550 [Glycine max]